ncbi:hypothetical protein HK099_000133, partial [Clydaea vesicula]
MNATTNWTLLKEQYYVKNVVYELNWNIKDISKFIVTVSKCGGAIATIRNDKVMFQLNSQPTVPILNIYSASGKTLTQIKWDKGRIVGFGWVKSEKLCCVLEYGSVRLYNLHGEYTQFSLGQIAKDFGVLDCRVWEDGLVVLTGNFKFIFVSNINETRPKLMSDPGLTEIPHSWEIIKPEFSSSGHLEILVSVNSTVLTVDPISYLDQLLNDGPYTKISVSASGKFIALFTVHGKLLVKSKDFQKTLAEFKTNSSSVPMQLEWCGTDSVILHWENFLLMVGPGGDWVKYQYDGYVFLSPEDDGIRIFGPKKSEFLQKVPEPNEKIFKFGSTDPGAILFDAYDHFEKKSPKADENIRSIKTELTEAVDTCIAAAGNEIDIQLQKTLLKVSSFGKCFLDYYNSERFVTVCQYIRILNAVRDDEVGIHLTYSQFLSLTPELLVKRLVNRNLHLLALRISEYLKLNTNKVLIHWACAKIKNSANNEESISKLILDTLGRSKSGISYAEVANAAYKQGHHRLATKLLNFEPQAANQVPLLLTMEEDKIALQKATESGNTDLVYLVLLHVKRKLPIADLFLILNGNPLATNLLISYCKQMDPLLLKNFYYQEDKKGESAKIIVKDNASILDVNEKITQLKMAYKLFNDDRDYIFEAKATDEQIRLLQSQIQLERDTGHTFSNLSI